MAARVSANGPSLSPWDQHSDAQRSRNDRADDSARENSPSHNLGGSSPKCLAAETGKVKYWEPSYRFGSIKGEVKKKHFSAGWTFSCFAAHIIEQDLY